MIFRVNVTIQTKATHQIGLVLQPNSLQECELRTSVLTEDITLVNGGGRKKSLTSARYC